MAIVGRFSVEKAASVKQEVKQSLTRRLKERVGIHDSSSSSESSSDESDSGGGSQPGDEKEKDATSRGEGKRKRWGRRKKSKKHDVEQGEVTQEDPKPVPKAESRAAMQITWAKVTSVGREQNFPDDAVLNKEGAEEVCPRVQPD